jgi:hypothetical protein
MSDANGNARPFCRQQDDAAELMDVAMDNVVGSVSSKYSGEVAQIPQRTVGGWTTQDQSAEVDDFLVELSWLV